MINFTFFILTFLMLIAGLEPAISLVSDFNSNLSPFGFTIIQFILFISASLTGYLIFIKLWGGWQAFLKKQPYLLKLEFTLKLLWLIYSGILCFFTLPENGVEIEHIGAVLLLFLAIPFGVIFSIYSLTLNAQFQSKK